MKCGGIVLCGGQSQRMGTSKAALPFGPETMLARVVRVLRGVVDPVVVVAADGQALPELPRDVLVTRDRQPGRGPLEGIRAGLESLANQAEMAYATGCDVPLLRPEFVRQLIGKLEHHAIAVPTDGQFFHPLAAVYRCNVLGYADRLLDQRRLRPAFLFNQVDTVKVPVEELRAVDPDLESLMNVNRPEDYAQALTLAGFTWPGDQPGLDKRG